MKLNKAKENREHDRKCSVCAPWEGPSSRRCSSLSRFWSLSSQPTSDPMPPITVTAMVTLFLSTPTKSVPFTTLGIPLPPYRSDFDPIPSLRSESLIVKLRVLVCRIPCVKCETMRFMSDWVCLRVGVCVASVFWIFFFFFYFNDLSSFGCWVVFKIWSCFFRNSCCLMMMLIVFRGEVFRLCYSFCYHSDFLFILFISLFVFLFGFQWNVSILWPAILFNR